MLNTHQMFSVSGHSKCGETKCGEVSSVVEYKKFSIMILKNLK